jgi:branched-subunit amino acid transport protein AzlD
MLCYIRQCIIIIIIIIIIIFTLWWEYLLPFYLFSARKGDRESVRGVLGKDASSVVINDRDKV